MQTVLRAAWSGVDKNSTLLTVFDKHYTYKTLRFSDFEL
jgi:hypothetical protein